MRIDEPYIRLMNEEIDGVISEENARKLAAFVMSDPEARRYYEDLRETVRALGEAGEVEPPPELRERIFDAVYGQSGGQTVQPVAAEHSFWRSFVPAFAAGVAAGLIIFAAIRPLTDRSPKEPGYEATIGAVEGGGGAAERFDAYGVKGSVLPVFERGSITVTMSMASDTEASILFDLGDGVSFESIRSNEGADYQMEVDGKSLLLVHGGDAEFIIRFRSADTPALDLRIFAGGKTVAAMRLSTGG
jgi:anti-sigma-K factor RskA